MPELLDRKSLTGGVALNSAGFNVSRAVGPAEALDGREVRDRGRPHQRLHVGVDHPGVDDGDPDTGVPQVHGHRLGEDGEGRLRGVVGRLAR